MFFFHLHLSSPLSDYAHIKRTENIIAIGNPVTIPVYFVRMGVKTEEEAAVICRKNGL